MASFAQDTSSDESGRIRGLENAWGCAHRSQGYQGLDMLLANSFVAVEIDGSVSSENEFPAGIKAPEYQPSQAQ